MMFIYLCYIIANIHDHSKKKTNKKLKKRTNKASPQENNSIQRKKVFNI